MTRRRAFVPCLGQIADVGGVASARKIVYGPAHVEALYLQGSNDAAHPRPDLDRFLAAYRKAGGRVDLELFEGESEGFMARNPVAAARAIELIVEFVHKELR